MKLPDERKHFADRIVSLLAKAGLQTSREQLAQDIRRFALIFVLAVTIAGVMIPGLLGSQYPVGDELLGTFATTNYKADRDYEIPDTETSERLRIEAVETIPPVFDLELRTGTELAQKIGRAFEYLNKVALADGPLHEDGGRSDAGEAAQLLGHRFSERLQAAREDFERLLQIPVETASYDALIGAAFDRQLGAVIAREVEQVLRHGVVADRALLLAEGLTNITVHQEPLGNNSERVLDVNALRDLAEAREVVARKLGSALSDRSSAVIDAVTQIASAAMQPTLIPNRSATDERRRVASTSVKPVTIKVRRGEMILRDGDPFQPRHLLIFRGMREAQRSQKLLVFGLGIALIVGLLVVVLTWFSHRSLRGHRLEEKDVLTLSIVLLATVVMTSAWGSVAPLIQERVPGIPLDALRQIVPVAFGPMLIGFLFSAHLTLAFCIVTALLAGLAMEGSLVFAIYTFVVGVTAATGVARARQRTTLLKAGLVTGFTAAAAGFCLMLSSSTDMSWQSAAAHVGFGFVSGVTASVLVAGLVPIFEAIFGYVSDIKLLELANLNHPLLRELIVQAPGTYHHSIIIGSLVEAAAEAIRANSLLARVMAYYHDIGKVKNPRYFAENQRDSNNPHDKLAPSMSALVLRAHVKDGLELARQHKIPSVVADVISEHHGNNLMSFFYNKAKEAENADAGTVNDMDYRYAGRRPRSRETALVMIADVVEAASRSVPEPTSDRLMGLVQKTINRLFADGSLNESDLTLKDLHEIAKSFHRVLLGIYHERPAYQTSATKERRDTKETQARRSDTREIPKERGVERKRTSELPRVKENDEAVNEHAAQGEADAKSKSGAQGDGERALNGNRQQGEHGYRNEPSEENLKRLGSDH